jgi:hypothetical protein
MKKLSILVLIAFTAITACKKDDLTVKFNMDYTFDFTIPAALANSPITIPTPDIQTNSSASFSNNNTHADKVEEIKLSEMKLTIFDPPAKSFSFLKSVHIYISADGLAEQEIAYKDNIDNSVGHILILDRVDVNLAEYIKKDRYKISVKSVSDELTNEDIDVKADLIFAVVAAPLK